MGAVSGMDLWWRRRSWRPQPRRRGDAWRRVGLPASPGPAWASAEYCSDVLGQPRPSSVLQVGLAQRAAGRPCRHKRQSGCGGHGYLVFWRSSRSQVGSVWPILYSSLESSMLWSR